MKTLFDEMEHAVKNWWLSLILGILYIIVALCLLFAPGSSYIALSVIFSISMLISGIIEIIFSISNRRSISSWGWYLAGGIIDLILGIYLVAYPLLSMEVIPFIVAFWMMFRGFSATGYSMDLKRYGTREWMVHGLRYPCHHLFADHTLATGRGCTLRYIHAGIHLPDHRFLPGHALLRTENPS